MPIDLRKHDTEDPITIRPETTKSMIIKLLYHDTNLGFTPSSTIRGTFFPPAFGICIWRSIRNNMRISLGYLPNS
jgi:hypothetical protein